MVTVPLNCLALLCLLLLPLGPLMAQQPEWKWGIRGGSEGYNLNGSPFDETAEDMAVDADGNVYVVSTLGGGMGKRGPTLSGVPNNLPFYTVANGGNVHFTYTGSPNYDSLEWSFGTGQVQTTTGGSTTHAYTETGEKWVCVTAYDDSCGFDTWCALIDPFLIGTPEALESDRFKYYPNPAQEGFTLECREPLTYTLFDLTGREVQSGAASTGATWIPMENAQSGIYLLRLANGAGAVATVKIVKE